MPSTVVKAIAEMIANSSLAHAAGQERGGHVAVGGVEGAAGHGAEAHVEREHVEEPDAGDADDRALAGGRLVLHRVVADEDVRQRRRAAEQGEHQREKVELVGELVAADAGEGGAGAGLEDLAAGRRLGDRTSVRFGARRSSYRFVTCSSSTTSLCSSVLKNSSGPSGPVLASTPPGRLADRSRRVQYGPSPAPSTRRQAVDERRAIGCCFTIVCGSPDAVGLAPRSRASESSPSARC